MPNLQPVTLQRYASRRWLRTGGYAFAAQDAFVALVALELPRAMLSLPIAFIPQGEGYVIAAILSLQPGKNLFVAQSGSWAGDYIPTAFRAHPFCLAQTDTGQQVLCIDEDSGTLRDGPEGNRFFEDNGQVAKATLDVLNFLKEIEPSRQSTVVACATLQKHGLICPWPLNTKTETGEKQIAGLFRIDEAALNKLPGEALQDLAKTGALVLAYCQLLSMQHLPILRQMAEAHAKAAQSLATSGMNGRSGTPDQSFFKKNETISFSGLF